MTLEIGVKRTLSATNRITLRLPTNILEVLKGEAGRKDIPLNALVTKILTKNIAFDTSINLIPNITIPHFLFAKIIDSLGEQSFEELAKEGPSLVKKLFVIQGIRYELKEVIDNYFLLVGKHCGWYKFTYDAKSPYYRLVFETQSTQQWTKFLSAYVKFILESLRVNIENHSLTDNVIVFEIRDYRAR